MTDPAESNTTELQPPRKQGSARALFASVHLFLTTFIVLFAALATWGLRLASARDIWIVAIIAGLLCVVGAILMRRVPLAGIVVGAIVHLGLLLSGFFVPLTFMFVLAVVLTAIFVGCLVTGRRIDIERAERYDVALARYEEQLSSQGDDTANSGSDQT